MNITCFIFYVVVGACSPLQLWCAPEWCCNCVGCSHTNWLIWRRFVFPLCTSVGSCSYSGISHSVTRTLSFTVMLDW